MWERDSLCLKALIGLVHLCTQRANAHRCKCSAVGIANGNCLAMSNTCPDSGTLGQTRAEVASAGAVSHTDLWHGLARAVVARGDELQRGCSSSIKHFTKSHGVPPAGEREHRMEIT